MKADSFGAGALASFLLLFPIGVADLYVAFNNSIGNWAASFLFLPYAIYLGLAATLRWKHQSRLARGLAVVGVVLATFIIAGVILLALVFSAATEFG